MARRLIEMHGGRLTAASAGLGQGATFEIRLPRLERSHEVAGDPQGTPVVPRRILIVDDNADAANSLALVLGLDGHVTEVVYSGTGALKRADDFKPEVVLLDIGLPEMDGYQVARRLRARPELAGTRIVALTGYGQSDDVQRSREVGFGDHLTKPVDFAALARTLETAIAQALWLPSPVSCAKRKTVVTACFHYNGPHLGTRQPGPVRPAAGVRECVPRRSSMPLPVTRSGNPSLSERVFANQPRPAYGAERMTLQGSINKAFMLLVVLLAGAFWPWSQYLTNGDLSAVSGALTIGALGGLVVGLIISFKANLAPYLSVPYAALEGLAIGGISAVLERRYPGIAIQAVGLTFAVFAVMLVAFKLGIIRATERFRAIVIGATGAIAVFYLVSMLLGFFHVSVPLLNSSSPLGIVISLVIVGVAALNLILDFDFIESGAAQGAPRYMEWYAAFGLLVTMVWLYMEILRLLSKTRRD